MAISNKEEILYVGYESSDVADIKFKIKIHSISWGFINSYFTVDGVTFFYNFDAAADYVIDLMRIYLAVRDYEKGYKNTFWKEDKISYELLGYNRVNLNICHFEDGYFKLQVQVKYPQGKGKEFETLKKSVILTEKELLSALDSFFRQILNNRGFPIKYPIGCEGLSEAIDMRVRPLRCAIMQVLSRRMYCTNDLFEEIDSICTNATLKLPANLQALADDYREMLEKHVIPHRFKKR